MSNHTYPTGSWQATLADSEVKRIAGNKNRKAASTLLWQGAQAAIADWLPNSDTDRNGEGLYNEAMSALGGTHRKGDASKIKTVALAVRDHGLVLTGWPGLRGEPNLSKAYAEAVRRTKTVEEQADEDAAAEKAIGSLNVPNSTTTIDGAAAMLLSKGVDGAVVAILDALGANNEAAHRAFMRAVSVEIAARVQANKPAPKAKASGPKAGATKASKSTPAKATVSDGAAKPKPTKAAAPTKAKATGAKPKPVSVSKGDPNARPLPPKAKPVKAKPVSVA